MKNYRADIDGLRAIAVILVVLYHLRTARCTGGFVGVDVFFVISGYLLSALIMSDIEAGEFTIANFYEKRIRRIFPALIALLFGVAVMGCLFLFPTELSACGKSLLAALFSVSNFYFWKHSGYFAATTAVNPLLHTWSLAVEEQFYLVLPLFLKSLRSISRPRVITILSGIASLSLLVSSITAARGDSSAFYMLHSRAWELLLGTLLALTPEPVRMMNAARNGLSMIGLGLILYPSFAYNDSKVFPGLTAVAPCLGTALVIYAGSGTQRNPLINQLLSLPPLRFIGLISYSLYLWHWPLVVLSRTYTEVEHNISPRLVKISLLIMSIGIATISWRFVELPFRYGRFRPSPGRLFRMALVSIISLAVIGTSLAFFSGKLTLWSGKAAQVASFIGSNGANDWIGQSREGRCFIDFTAGESFDAGYCLQTKTGKKNYLLLGDSHAAALWFGLANTYEDVNLMQATAAGCKPLLEDSGKDTLNRSAQNNNQCQSLVSFIYFKYLPTDRPDALLIAAQWKAEDLPRIARTLEWTSHVGIKTFLFGPLVEYDSDLPKLLAFSIKHGDRTLLERHMLRSEWPLDAQMSQLADQNPNVQYVSLIRLLCQQYECITMVGDGVPLEFDSNHLTKQGSLLTAQRIRMTGVL